MTLSTKFIQIGLFHRYWTRLYFIVAYQSITYYILSQCKKTPLPVLQCRPVSWLLFVYFCLNTWIFISLYIYRPVIIQYVQNKSGTPCTFVWLFCSCYERGSVSGIHDTLEVAISTSEILALDKVITEYLLVFTSSLTHISKWCKNKH